MQYFSVFIKYIATSSQIPVNIFTLLTFEDNTVRIFSD